MRILRAFPVLVLGLALGSSGCQGMQLFQKRPPKDGAALERLEATQPAGERLPEIVALPPVETPPPAIAPTAVPAAAKPAGIAKAEPGFDEDIVLPRRTKSAPKSTKPRAGSTYSGKGKTYTVQRGDTLQKISQKIYGTTKKWQRIFEANRGKLKKPDMVVVGTVLAIP